MTLRLLILFLCVLKSSLAQDAGTMLRHELTAKGLCLIEYHYGPDVQKDKTGKSYHPSKLFYSAAPIEHAASVSVFPRSNPQFDSIDTIVSKVLKKRKGHLVSASIEAISDMPQKFFLRITLGSNEPGFHNPICVLLDGTILEQKEIDVTEKDTEIIMMKGTLDKK